MGIRDLTEVQVSLFMKYAWKMLVGGSLWSDFFKAKYMGNLHIAALINSNRGTRFWKGVLRVVPHVLNSSRFLVQRGEVNFWYDNWMGDGAVADEAEVFGDPTLKLREVVSDRAWDLCKLRELLSDNMVTKISSMQLRLR